MAEGGRRPLIVVSHGTGGSAAQLSWLAEHLASNGYVVAGVNHHGNTAAEPAYAPEGFVRWAARAVDLGVVLDHLLREPLLADGIDTTRIGVAGFSLGGYAALLAVGARTDLGRWRRHCEAYPDDPTCTLPPEAPFTLGDVAAAVAGDTDASAAPGGPRPRDERFRAAFLLAPALFTALDPASLDGVTVPVRIVVGDRDDQALADRHIGPLAGRIPAAEYQVLGGVGHYTFLAPCTPRGRVAVRLLCAEPGPVDRRGVHEAVAADVLEFFDRTLAPGPRRRAP